MPYVALAPATRTSRLAVADGRWRAVLAGRPDLEPAVTLQRALIGRVIDLAEHIEQNPLPRLSLPPKYVATKLARRVPALANEPLPIPVSALKPTLLELCGDLARGGGGEAADHIRTAIESGSMDAGSVLAASLSRDQQAIRTGAVHRGLAPDLLWLVAELAVSPFAHALQRAVFASDVGTLPSALGAWNEGYCPACGSWPALAEVVSSHRVLRCSFCAAAWELNQYACVYCHEQDEKFVTSAPNAERAERRLELCRACGAYLKAMEVPELSPFPLLAINDLETMDLDMTAMEHRYGRPTLKNFGRAEA